MANAQLDFKFIDSHRDGRILCMQGFMFRCQKTKGNWKSWKCLEKTCRASFHEQQHTIAVLSRNTTKN